MASLQEPGLVRLYKKSPDGNKRMILQYRVEQLAPAGGAPDGAPASVSTPEKLLTVDSPIELVNDDILELTFEADAADGIDVSDSLWSIPVVTLNGTKAIGRQQFANPAPADYTTVASVEMVVGGYKVVEGRARISGKIYADVQDDTA